jgi:ribosomal protein S18 acetylase RimI-like enzyme
MANISKGESEVEIILKADNQLSKNELRMIFHLYNDSFCDNRICNSKKINLAKELLGGHDMFDWYLAKINGEIVGMVSFVRRFPSNLNNQYYAIRPDKGENVCSLCVTHKYRRYGIARKLMETIIQDHGSRVSIVVEIKKTSKMYSHLVKFYESLGFVIFEEDVKPDDNLFMKYVATVPNNSE